MSKFIILSRSRCGSTLLMSFLNSHPYIECQGEIAKQLDIYKNPLKRIKNLYKPSNKLIKCSGFKLFIYHGKEYTDVWDYLVNNINIKVIHLSRKDVFSMLVSHKLMTKGGPCKINNPNKRDMNTTITITPEEYITWYDNYEADVNIGKELFKYHPSLDITYEDMITRKHIISKEIQKFLDVKYRHFQTDLIKQQIRKLPEVVSNYNELKEQLKDTKYGQQF